jgi:glutamyl-tRNA synthetase
MSTTNDRIRVRIAPGPTGPFHMGRSRTALINWLFARHHGGTFVLRIEDTDQVRSKPEYLDSILESLRWLGLDWDEGPEIGGPYAPYFQMSRLDTYPPFEQRLLDTGHAYRCYCTAQELHAQRRQAQEDKRPFRYPRTCRFLTPAERADRESGGRSWVIRLAVQDGTTRFQDLVMGDIGVDNSEIDDFILVRSDRSPTYNFVVVVDDLTMKITHVLRGQDHVPNTPKQILIYQYLGESPPLFGHLPLVVGLEDQKISARHGAKAVSTWGHEGGYLPDAVVNYLATVGISYEEGREIFSREELIRLFDLSKVGKSRSKLDEEKLDWVNGMYIRALPLDEFVRLCLPYLELHGLVSTPPGEAEIAHASAALRLEQERIRTLAEAPAAVEFFLRDEIVYDPALLVQKKSTAEEATHILDGTLESIERLETFTHELLEPALRTLAEHLGLKTGTVFGTIRVAVTGRAAAPPLFETMDVLGRDRVLKRLRAARESVQALNVT